MCSFFKLQVQVELDKKLSDVLSIEAVPIQIFHLSSLTYDLPLILGQVVEIDVCEGWICLEEALLGDLPSDLAGCLVLGECMEQLADSAGKSWWASKRLHFDPSFGVVSKHSTCGKYLVQLLLDLSGFVLVTWVVCFHHVVLSLVFSIIILPILGS